MSGLYRARLKWIGTASLFFVLLLLYWMHFLNTVLISVSPGVRVVVQPGESLHSVIEDIAHQPWMRYPLSFRLYATVMADKQSLKAGEYWFVQTQSTPHQIIHQLMTGTGLVQHAFTIVPGWTFHQLRLALDANPWIRHTIQMESDEDVMNNLHAGLHPSPLNTLSMSMSPEGQFAPNTYYFVKDTQDKVLLKQAYAALQKTLVLAYQQRDPNLPYHSMQEALIMASLIEKEGYLDQERPLIASVFVNRLRKNMILQCDSTVIFGLGARYDGKIYKSNLKENTPYNTYIHPGLPPTPIAFPSLPSLNAALHPAKETYYYFVARGDGSHQFSKSLTEHVAAIKAIHAMQKSGKQPIQTHMGSSPLKSSFQHPKVQDHS